MLVLRRKLGEVIRIGDAVRVRVLEFRGNQVHLGLEAPPEVKIFREEVYRAMVKDGEAAAGDRKVLLDGSTTTDLAYN